MEGDSVIEAKSECFLENLISSIRRLRSNNRFCDVTIMCADTELKVHKTVLASATEYFEAMFGNDTKEACTGTIDFSHFPTEVVKQCIDFMYSGKVEISTKTVKDMLNLTERMQLNDLSTLCVKFLAESISMENCSEMVVLSNLHCKESLSGKIGIFLERNFKEFIETDDFKSLEYDSLLHCFDLLQDAVTDKMCEVDKWNGMMSWISYDLEQRKNRIFKLFVTMNLSCLSKDYLKENILSEPIVNESSECLALIAKHCVDEQPSSVSPKKCRGQALYFQNESHMIVRCDAKSGKYLPPIAFPGKFSDDVSVIFNNDCIYVGDGERLYRFYEGEWNMTRPEASDFQKRSYCSLCRRESVHNQEAPSVCFCRCVEIGNYVYMITSKKTYQFNTTDLKLEHHVSQILLPNKFFISAFEDQIFILSEDDDYKAYVYDTSAKMCSRIKDMPVACHAGLALWYNQRLFTFCYKRNEPACIVSVYDREIDCWALVLDIEVDSIPKSFYIGDKLYLTGENHENICAEIDLGYLKSIQVEMESRKYVMKCN